MESPLFQTFIVEHLASPTSNEAYSSPNEFCLQIYQHRRYQDRNHLLVWSKLFCNFVRGNHRNYHFYFQIRHKFH